MNYLTYSKERWEIANSIGLFTWGAVREAILKKIGKEAETMWLTYAAIQFSFFLVMLYVYIISLELLYLHLVNVAVVVATISLALWTEGAYDRRFGARVQQTLEEVNQEVFARTHHRLEYKGRSVNSDYTGNPTIVAIACSPSS